MYRLEKDFYFRVKDKIKGVWGKIFVVYIISAFIIGMVQSRSSIVDVFSYISNPSLLSDAEVEAVGSFSFMALVVAIVTSTIALSLHMETYRYLKTDKFEISGIFKNINEYGLKILLAGTIKGILSYFLPMIPLGGIVWIIVDYGFAYVAYLMLELPEKDIFSYFRDSWRLTEGKKFDSFKIGIHYYLFVFVAFFFMVVSVLIAVVGSNLGNGGIQGIGLILAIVLMIIVIIGLIVRTPYVVIANALYFEEHIEHEQIYLYDL